MEPGDLRSRRTVNRALDVHALAAEAVVAGCARAPHWEALLALSGRRGFDAAAQDLVALLGPGGPSARWWRCQLQLCASASLEDTTRLFTELAALELSGAGPHYDLDRHALEVSSVVRFLQTYLERLRRDEASGLERCAALMLVHCSRVASGFGRVSL